MLVWNDNGKVQITEASPSIQAIELRLSPLRQQLHAHSLYNRIHHLRDIRLFMESHVFAVWDFMSLLKALQRTLTCVDVPWVPTPFPRSRRFINEIVLGEESDEYQGRAISHFELYLEAMEQAKADTRPIRRLLSSVSREPGELIFDDVPPAAREFVTTTFQTIRDGSPAALAAAFAFGREDAIPAMFRSLVRHLSHTLNGELDLFVWYLERHIEIDGEDHGPLAVKMVSDLCGDDPEAWEDASQAAEQALRARLKLWDGVLAQIDVR